MKRPAGERAVSRGGGMLLYFGSSEIMQQGNTCLCDVHHIWVMTV